MADQRDISCYHILESNSARRFNGEM